MPLEVKRVAAAVLLTAVGFVSAAVEARGAGEKSLRWKFEPGQTVQYRMTQETVMSSEFDGKKIETKANQVVDATRLVESVDEEGTAQMTQHLDRMRLKTVGALEGDVDYDSDTVEPPTGIAVDLSRAVKAVLKKPFQLKMSTRGEISDPKLPQEFIEAVKEPALVQMGDVLLKQMAGDSGLIFPTEPVKKGGTWQESTEIETPTGMGEVTRKYTYLGEVKRDGQALEKIDVEVETTLGVDENAQVKVEITSQESSGTLLFDPQAGRLIEGKVSSKVKMKVSAMGREMAQEITTKGSIALLPTGKTSSGKTPGGDAPAATEKPKSKTPAKK